VSVVIPTYNEERNIANLLRDIENLDYENKEIIVIDDGSTDRTREILKEHDNVKSIFLSHRGVAHALNAGFKEATGDFIYQVAANCTIKNSNLIRDMIKNFTSPSIVAVWSALEVGNKDKFFPSLMDAAKRLNPSYLYGGSSVMFRADFIKKHPYDEGRGFTGADFEMREKISESEFNCVYTPDVKVYVDYPEGFKGTLKQRFRYSRSHIRLMKRRFNINKLIPIFRDWTVAGGLLLLPFINPLLWCLLLTFVIAYFFRRTYKVRESYEAKEYVVYSVFAEILFVFVRSLGYLWELMS